MKIGKLIFGMLFILLLAYPAFSEEMEAIKSIPVGKLEVLALTDSRGMVATLMPDLAEDPNFEPMFKMDFLRPFR